MDSKACLNPSFPILSSVFELSETLLVEAEHKLLEGHFPQASLLFEEMDHLLEEGKADLYYRMGLALFEYGSEKNHAKALLLACKKLNKAYELNLQATDVLHVWANVLVFLGELLKQPSFFLMAQHKYEKALLLEEPSVELLWDCALLWHHLGNYSEEAIDFQKAIQFYEKAANGKHLPKEFWIDYGTTALLLADKIRDVRQIVKAVNCFKYATTQDETCFEGWSHLAEALQTLYTYSHDEDHFSQTHECFATGHKLHPQNSTHLLNWAKFLLVSVRRSHDLKRLRICIEKCQQAYANDPTSSSILTTWAEALALLGQLTEKLDLLYDAENKIEEAFELDENDPQVWYSFGMCLNSFGAYFNDNDYYYQAIEKFQSGLSIDRTYDCLWHAMANAYTTVGGLEGEPDTIIQGLKFYEKALTLFPSSTRYVDYAIALSKLGELSHQQKWLEQALSYFEISFNLQKNAVYLHPEWLFAYASTLDMLGDFHEEEKYYTRAIDIFSHVLMIDPDFLNIHHRLAQAFCHLGEVMGEVDHFYRAIHHLRLALKRDEDNDAMILDWGITLINIAQYTPILTDMHPIMQEAKQKLILSAKLGNPHAYYHLSCLHSLLNQYDSAMYFLLKADHFNVLPPLEDLLHDEWLDALRTTLAFKEFLAKHPNFHEER